MIRCFYTRIGQNACRAVILDMPPRGALTLQTRGSARFGKITKTEDFLTEGNEANEGLFFRTVAPLPQQHNLRYLRCLL
jgi:hypothetical protein